MSAACGCCSSRYRPPMAQGCGSPLGTLGLATAATEEADVVVLSDEDDDDGDFGTVWRHPDNIVQRWCSNTMPCFSASKPQARRIRRLRTSSCHTTDSTAAAIAPSSSAVSFERSCRCGVGGGGGGGDRGVRGLAKEEEGEAEEEGEEEGEVVALLAGEGE